MSILTVQIEHKLCSAISRHSVLTFSILGNSSHVKLLDDRSLSKKCCHSQIRTLTNRHIFVWLRSFIYRRGCQFSKLPHSLVTVSGYMSRCCAISQCFWILFISQNCLFHYWQAGLCSNTLPKESETSVKNLVSGVVIGCNSQCDYQ